MADTLFMHDRDLDANSRMYFDLVSPDGFHFHIIDDDFDANATVVLNATSARALRDALNAALEA